METDKLCTHPLLALTLLSNVHTQFIRACPLPFQVHLGLGHLGLPGCERHFMLPALSADLSFAAFAGRDLLG